MFDEVQIGWLDNDDYRRAAERAGVVELPDGPIDVTGTDGTDGTDEPSEPARAMLGLRGEVAYGR